jgi:hypothetical protein
MIKIESATVPSVPTCQRSNTHLSILILQGKGIGRTLRTEELSGDVQSLASHDDDLLAVEQLLGHGAG